MPTPPPSPPRNRRHALRGLVFVAAAVIPVAADRLIEAVTGATLGSAERLAIAALSGIAAAFFATRIRDEPAARANPSLERQQRFLATAAHELRAPIATIRSIAEGGVRNSLDPVGALRDIADLARDANSMVQDLLALARIDAGKEEIRPEPVRLDLLATECVRHRGGIALAVAESVVHADPRLLRHAITNLVENALRHGRSLDGQVDVIVSVDGPAVEVRDRGPGIDSTLLPHIWERFRSGPGSEGSGIGLWLVDWIVRAHGGQVTAGNAPEGGAVFRLVLPSRP